MPDYPKSGLMSGVKIQSGLYIINGRYRVEFTLGTGWTWTDSQHPEVHGPCCDAYADAMRDLGRHLDAERRTQ